MILQLIPHRNGMRRKGIRSKAKDFMFYIHRIRKWVLQNDQNNGGSHYVDRCRLSPRNRRIVNGGHYLQSLPRLQSIDSMDIVLCTVIYVCYHVLNVITPFEWGQRSMSSLFPSKFAISSFSVPHILHMHPSASILIVKYQIFILCDFVHCHIRRRVSFIYFFRVQPLSLRTDYIVLMHDRVLSESKLLNVYYRING